MAFDVGAGLSSMGAAVADTAKGLTLEAQKAELEKEKVILADQLAGKREDTQRQFQTSERLSTQQFMSGENVLGRLSAKEIAQLTADSHLKGTAMTAGAAIAVGRLNLEGHKYTADLGAKTAELNRDLQLKLGLGQIGETRYHTDVTAATAKDNRDLQLRMGQKVIPGENGTLAVLSAGESKPTPVLNPDGTPFKSTDPELLKGQVAILNGAMRDKQDLLRDLKSKVDPLVSQINVLTKSALPGQKLDAATQQQVEALHAEIDKATERSMREVTEAQIKIDGYVGEFMNRKRQVPAVAPQSSPGTPSFGINRSGGARPTINPADFYEP